MFRPQTTTIEPFEPVTSKSLEDLKAELELLNEEIELQEKAVELGGGIIAPDTLEDILNKCRKDKIELEKQIEKHPDNHGDSSHRYVVKLK